MEYFILYIIEYSSIHDSKFRLHSSHHLLEKHTNFLVLLKRTLRAGLSYLSNLSLPHTFFFGVITVAWTDHTVKQYCAFAHLFLDFPSFSLFPYPPAEYLLMFQDHSTTNSFLKTFLFQEQT